MNEIQNESSDDGVSGDALGDLNIFNPGYSLITWPKDKVKNSLTCSFSKDWII